MDDPPAIVPVSILIVDDNEKQLLALESTLGDLDLEIVSVTSGRAALRELLHRSFALVLLDVNLPGLDGFEIAALIRERPHTRNVPIIFMTAYGDDVYVERGYSLGAVDFMLMPIVPEVLRTKVSVFIELHRQAEQLRQQAERLEQRAAQLASLARQLTIAEEQERRRVADLLHDHVQQLLAGGMMLVRNVGRKQPSLAADLDEIEAVLRESLQASRSLAREISPPLLRNAGLIRALEEICARFEHQHGLSCALETPARLPRLNEALEAFLYHAIGELLLNVVKHAQANRARIAVTASADALSVAVEDDGVGFADPPGAFLNGAGGHFGLDSIHQRVELFEGSLTLTAATAARAAADAAPDADADSEAGGNPGARAVITLPLIAGNLRDAAPWQAPSEATAEAPAGAPRRVRLLIVDDHEMIRRGLRSMLACEPGIEIVGEARDGHEAVRLAAELDPDVILMDLFMPGADGLQATREILSARPRAQVVAMSTSNDEHVVAPVLQAGASAFLSKTCSLEQLKAAIRV